MAHTPHTTAAAPDDFEREAYNAAFYELGLRWHWDGDTYQQLQRAGELPATRLRHYLETRQGHLLRAYDADFLVNAIEHTKAAARVRLQAQSPASGGARRFDWAQSLGRELGA